MYVRFYTEELVPSDVVSASITYDKPKPEEERSQPESSSKASPSTEDQTNGSGTDDKTEESSEKAAPEDANPEIAQLKARIQELRLQLIDLATQLVSALQAQIQGAR